MKLLFVSKSGLKANGSGMAETMHGEMVTGHHPSEVTIGRRAIGEDKFSSS